MSNTVVTRQHIMWVGIVLCCGLAASSAIVAVTTRADETGSGYTLSTRAPLEHYTLRVEPVDAQFTETVRDAARIVSGGGGTTFTVGERLSDGAETPRAGEVLVSIGSLCGTDGEAGCTGYYYDSGLISAAHVSVTREYSTREELLGVLVHELGHVAGLAHHSGEFEGEHQNMHPLVTHHSGVLAAGDIAGLRAAAERGRVTTAERSPTGALTTAVWDQGVLTVTGRAYDPDVGVGETCVAFRDQRNFRLRRRVLIGNTAQRGVCHSAQRTLGG